MLYVVGAYSPTDSYPAQDAYVVLKVRLSYRLLPNPLDLPSSGRVDPRQSPRSTLTVSTPEAFPHAAIVTSVVVNGCACTLRHAPDPGPSCLVVERYAVSMSPSRSKWTPDKEFDVDQRRSEHVCRPSNSKE